MIHILIICSLIQQTVITAQTLPAGMDGNAKSLSKKVVKCVVDRSAEGRKIEHASGGVGRAGNGKDIPCLAKVSSVSD